MEPNEFGLLINGMRALFPTANICPDRESKTIWYRVLKDLDFKQAEAAVLRHACSSKFPPTIAEIREQAAQITAPERRDWLEGWADVQRAIHRWGMYRPEEALNALQEADPLTAKVAGMLGWQNLCLSENPTADRANFRQCYEATQRRDAENAKLPPALRPVLAAAAQALRLGEGGTP